MFNLKKLKLDAEAGTLVGPNDMGEPMVVKGRHPDGDGVTVGYAGTKDVEDAMRSIRLRGPRPPAEHALSIGMRLGAFGLTC